MLTCYCWKKKVLKTFGGFSRNLNDVPVQRATITATTEKQYAVWSWHLPSLESEGRRLDSWFSPSSFFFFPLKKSQDHPSSLLCSKHWSRFLTEATWAQITRDKSVSGFTPQLHFQNNGLGGQTWGPGCWPWYEAGRNPPGDMKRRRRATRPWESLKSASLDKACLGTHWQQSHQPTILKVISYFSPKAKQVCHIPTAVSKLSSFGLSVS